MSLGMTRCEASWHAIRDDGVLVHANDDFHWETCNLLPTTPRSVTA